ncbi:DUF2442 domain-containing protein [Biomaibacter acetigenes]|uniref:DUF2442 domain-containing protein n=1 Tax=Biomaibacter acetigenes TaxID=2316383 RepID=A0A3G2R939_9FIRM|nr:DUF2442 domain-containing protein [Biomaibacter acetigenes]AYO31956.1 DUF2442 domain-containing protein [Biomaibacter acetigenes]
MSILDNDLIKANAMELWFDDDKFYVLLSDGREIGVPLDWFPKLKKANDNQRSKWRLIGNGIGIHWEDLDEDISVEGLLIGRKAKH